LRNCEKGDGRARTIYATLSPVGVTRCCFAARAIDGVIDGVIDRAVDHAANGPRRRVGQGMTSRRTTGRRLMRSSQAAWRR
jgi:hypothetical protein